MNLMAQGLPDRSLGLFAWGLGGSALVGYLTVRYFIRYVARYPLHLFAAYRLALAAGVLVWVVGVREDSCALGFSWTLDCERVLAGGVSR